MTNTDKIITMSDEKLVESIPCPHMTKVNRENIRNLIRQLKEKL